MPHAGEARGQRRAPRVNAPVRRRPRSGSMPDVMMAFAFAGWAMAAVFLAASFVGEAIAEGEAGPGLARIFAGTLAFAALVVFLLGIALLRESQYIAVRIAYALVLGATVGLMLSVLFLNLAGMWIFLPLALLLLAIRPLREPILKTIGAMPRGDGRS
jgi:hypothetical protein